MGKLWVHKSGLNNLVMTQHHPSITLTNGTDMLIECADSRKIEFTYTQLNNPELLAYAKHKLPLHGILKQDETKPYCYLKISDDFIFQLFPLLNEKNIAIPEYFPPKQSGGAHISIMYQNEMEEKEIRMLDELGQAFTFEILDLGVIQAFYKTFFTLIVSSPALEQLRIKYGFQNRLNFHGLLVPFHITIAMGAGS